MPGCCIWISVRNKCFPLYSVLIFRPSYGPANSRDSRGIKRRMLFSPKNNNLWFITLLWSLQSLCIAKVSDIVEFTIQSQINCSNWHLKHKLWVFFSSESVIWAVCSGFFQKQHMNLIDLFWTNNVSRQLIRLSTIIRNVMVHALISKLVGKALSKSHSTPESFQPQLWNNNLLKVRKFQNENNNSSHCPKYEQNFLKNSALADLSCETIFLSH